MPMSLILFLLTSDLESGFFFFFDGGFHIWHQVNTKKKKKKKKKDVGNGFLKKHKNQVYSTKLFSCCPKWFSLVLGFDANLVTNSSGFQKRVRKYHFLHWHNKPKYILILFANFFNDIIHINYFIYYSCFGSTTINHVIYVHTYWCKLDMKIMD